MPKKNDDFFKQKKDWSEVKDELLGCYLTPYFAKILHTRKPILYIDGFAGKGKFDDGKNGSPLIALECLDRALNNYKGGHKLPKIAFKFIELNHAAELCGNLSENQRRYSEVVVGKFQEKLMTVLRAAAIENKNQNVFLYIDPYGVKALNTALFDALPSVFNTAELLINLNTWGFIRMVLAIENIKFRENEIELFAELYEYDNSTANTVEEVNTIAGGDYWKDIVFRYKTGDIDGHQAEKEFAASYKLRLREKYKYVLDMPIRLKASNHPKYRMVYATNHPEGCVIMAENIVARTAHLIINIQNSGQFSMFEETADNQIIPQDELLQKTKDLLENTLEYTRLNEFLASFYNEYGVICQPSKIKKDALEILEKSDFIEVIRTPLHTKTGKLSAFWSEGKGNIIEIKKK